MAPFRSRDTLQQWLAEFVELHTELTSEIRVIEQDSEDGADPGLVQVTLANATTEVYIQPVQVGSPEWVVTLEARDDVTLTAPEVLTLAMELTTLSGLCSFLQAQSTADLQADQD